MNKGNKFVTGCCITIGVGIAFCLTGFAMGAKVTGVGFGPHGISVYTPEGKVGEQQAVPKAGEEMLPEFDSIKIEVDYADVFLQPAEEYGISYRVDGGNLLSYEIEDGTLVIKESADKEGFHAEFIHIGYGVASGTEKGRIMVGLPEGCGW